MPFNDPPWHPMNNPVDKKHIGKLLEELGEAISASSRCLIQGVDEKEPTTGEVNRQWLRKELVDVLVNIELCDNHFNLQIWDDPEMITRYAYKLTGLRSWHKSA